jgi:hypothetical protein
MKHNFSPISKSLEKIMQKYNLVESYEINRLFNEWPKIVGKSLSKVSKPISYDNKKQLVIIKIKSESWKEEFSREKQNLLNKINDFLNSVIIKDIIFE